MTNRDTQDIIMGQLINLQEISDHNHALVTKSLETVAEVLALLNERIEKLEAEMKS